MGKESDYYTKKEIEQIETMQRLFENLPQFVQAYIMDKPGTKMTTSTRIAYAGDLIAFFNFLVNSNPVFKNKETKDFTFEDLEHLSPEDFDEYKSYLYGVKSKSPHKNGDAGIARKFAPLRGLYLYCNKRKYVKSNPLNVVSIPTGGNRNKTIIHMDSDQVHDLRNTILSTGNGKFSDKQAKFCDKTKQRDFAIIQLLLCTGMRVSELVGIDINDVNFKKMTVTLVRKGGGQDVIGFNKDAKDAIENYIEGERSSLMLKILEGNENALFISGKYRRISVDAVENIVKKYSQIAIPDMHITPHKIRSTYGTMLYNATGDINLTAKVLGHSSPTTTSRFYASLNQQRKEKAGQMDVYSENIT